MEIYIASYFADMEIIPEGKIFRLVQDEELPSILKVLEKHLPYALKVRRWRQRWLVLIYGFQLGNECKMSDVNCKSFFSLFTLLQTFPAYFVTLT